MAAVAWAGRRVRPTERAKSIRVRREAQFGFHHFASGKAYAINASPGGVIMK